MGPGAQTWRRGVAWPVRDLLGRETLPALLLSPPPQGGGESFENLRQEKAEIADTGAARASLASGNQRRLLLHFVQHPLALHATPGHKTRQTEFIF
jgi:hypothetical protein